MIGAVIAGLGAGGVYAVLAVSLTLMARLVRVVNFAQALIGGISVYCASVLHDHGMSFLAGSVLGLGATVLLAGVAGWILAHWFGEAGIDRRSAVTIGMLVALLSGSYLAFGSHPHQFPNLVPGSAFRLSDVEVSNATLLILILAVVVTVSSALVLSHTKLGLRLRALSERPRTAELLGIRSTPLTVGVWVATSLVVGIVIILAASTTVSDQGSLALLVVPGCAAALIGAFRRLDLALCGGLALGVLQSALAQTTALHSYRDVIPFVLILAALLWSQRREVWDEAR